MKLYDLLSNLWIDVIGPIPDYIDVAINWVCFAIVMIIILLPLIAVVVMIAILSRAFSRGKRYD
jgi:hypothetical protein